MASLESVRYTPKTAEVRDGQLTWIESKAKVIEALPQICWEDGSTWGEANLWALEQIASNKTDLKTVSRSMSHLLGYAKWLEAEEIKWWAFPSKESDRCLHRFRGALIRSRNDGELAPSTISQRMATVVRFYRWLEKKGLLSPEWPMWSERQIGIKSTDRFGFEHTIRVASTDLAIPNRRVSGAIKLEDGLLPLSVAGMQDVVDLARREASEELMLMLKLGFQTGMRLGSITDLKLKTLHNAFVDSVSGWHYLALGPRARPMVATKFGVSGMVPILGSLLEEIIEYSTSTRRLKRQALAQEKNNRELLFLTRYGNPYNGEKCRAVNVEMMRLRNAGLASGIGALRKFHFHQTRATFATELMRAALRYMPVGEAITFVKEACLHKDEITTLKYVRFLESSRGMSEAANAFTEAFLGLVCGGGE